MNTEIVRRTYQGKLSNKMTHMEQAELSAYLRGDIRFQYGFHPDKTRMYFDVKSAWLNQEQYEQYLSTLK